MDSKQIKINIPTDVNHIIHRLQSEGYEAYICGGAVRDSILNRTVHDWDICTSATPSEMLSIFSNERIIETGLQHGTITIILNKVGYEVTTFRKDGNYSDNRRPDSVEFVSDLIEDLSRRDFTINAMAYNDEDGLIDNFNGLEDIQYKKINCVGNAKDRFNEDALRILRAIRFCCQLDFVSSPDVSYQITQQYKLLSNVSKERINSELCKMIVCSNFVCSLVLYPEVFEFIMQGWEYENNQSIIKILNNDSNDSYDLIIVLTLLLRFSDADYIMRDLRFDNDTRIKVLQLIDAIDNNIYNGKADVKRLLNKIGEEQYKRYIKLLYIIWGKTHSYIIKYEENNLNDIIKYNECYQIKDLAINGKDVMEYMKVNGESVGYWLHHILDQVINENIKNTREDLIYYMIGVIDDKER